MLAKVLLFSVGFQDSDLPPKINLSQSFVKHFVNILKPLFSQKSPQMNSYQLLLLLNPTTQ